MRSSRKGSSFERDVCHQLSLWITNGINDDVLWRTSGSGARATSRGKKGLNTANSAGDIAYLSPEGKPLLDLVTFELKKGYNSVTIEQIFNGEIKIDPKKKQENLLSFFRQAIQSATEAGSPHWMVIHKPDHRDTMLYMDESLFDIVVTANKQSGLSVFRSMLLAVPCGENTTMALVGAMRYNDLLKIPYESVINCAND
jgi:hypothetical protein